MPIETLVKELNKKYKNNNLVLKAGVVPTFTRLRSKAFSVTYTLYGGYPEGTIIENSGPEHSGKSTGAFRTVADCQIAHPDKYVVYIDAECLVDIKFQAKMNGINLDKLYYVRPTGMSGEQILDLIIEFLKDDDIAMVVLDSLPALVPQIVWESDLTEDKGQKSNMANRLRLFLPMAKSLVAEKHSILLLINQVREKPVQVGAKTVMVPTEPCGSAVRFYSDIIIRYGLRTFTFEDDMDWTGKGKDKGEGADGFRLKYKIIKNKTAKVARGGGFITYRYETGMDWLHDLFEVAKEFGFIEKSGNQCMLVDLETRQILKDENGKDLKGYGKVLYEYLLTHPDFCAKYIDMLTKFITDSDASYGTLIDTSDIDAEQDAIDAHAEEN